VNILPEGESLRKAVKWVDEEQRDQPTKSLNAFVQEACLKFDLSPKDATFLDRFFKRPTQ
jgi:hypothetical protein